MATVVLDIVDGSEIREDSKGQKTVVRMALVSELAGNADAMLDNAHEDAALPSIDDAHPTIAGIKLIEKVTRGLACELAIVQLVYGIEPSTGSFGAKQAASDTGPTIIRGSYRLRATPRIFDKQSTPELLAVEPPQSVIDDEEQRTEVQKRPQIKTVNMLEPTHVVQHERLQLNHPAPEVRGNIGKRNIGIEGPYNPKELLFVGCDYLSTDGGSTYQCTYNFEVDDETKHEIPSVEWVDPQTGTPHPDNVTTAATGKTYPSKRENIEVTRGDTTLGTNLSISFSD